MRLLLVCAVAAALTGCVAETVRLKSSFNQSEAAYIFKRGKGSISGQAFLRRNDGIVVYAAGSKVYLLPDTEYARERLRKIYGDRKYNSRPLRFEKTDAEYEKYQRTIVADGEGRFSFDGLADGKYAIVTTVVWNVGGARQGGTLLEWATITNGNAAKVIMTSG